VEYSEHVFINTFSVYILSRSVVHCLCGVSMFYPCVLFSREYYVANYRNNLPSVLMSLRLQPWLEWGKVGLIHKMHGSDSCVANIHWIKLSTGTNALIVIPSSWMTVLCSLRMEINRNACVSGKPKCMFIKWKLAFWRSFSVGV